MAVVYDDIHIPESPPNSEAEVADLVKGGVWGLIGWDSEMLEWLDSGQDPDETELGEAGGDPWGFGMTRGANE